MPDESSVFISYAHLDSQADRVAGFVQFLHNCLPRKIDILLDRKILGIGKNIPDYMDRLEKSPVVVLLLTPEYKRRSESATGGVFREFDKIRRRFLEEDNDFLVLPVLFEGTSVSAIPELFREQVYEDFSAFHPRKNTTQPAAYYMSGKLREDCIPKFNELARAIESRITVRSAIPQDVFEQQLELLFAKTKVTRKWVALHPEFFQSSQVSTKA